MWFCYENALKIYYNLCIDEWTSRGYNNTMEHELIEGNVSFPFWLGDEQFHRSHRSNLLRKDFDYYSKFFDEESNLEYVWPV